MIMIPSPNLGGQEPECENESTPGGLPVKICLIAALVAGIIADAGIVSIAMLVQPV